MSYSDVFDACKFSRYNTQTGFKCTKKDGDITPEEDCKECVHFIDEVCEDMTN